MKKIAVYDFDNTLYSGNSLKDFVEFFISEEENFIRRLSMRIKYFIFLGVINRILRKSKTDFLVSNFNGYAKEYIEKCAIKFSNILNFHEAICKQLIADKKDGYEVWIVSGTIEEILSVYANKLNVVNWMSGKLNYTNNKCTGLLAFNMKGNKKEALISKFDSQDIDWKHSKFYSDNKEDYDCGRIFGVYVAVANSLKEKNNHLKHTKNIILIKKNITLSLIEILLPGYYYAVVRSGLYSLVYNRIGFISLAFYLFGSLDILQAVILGFIFFVILYEIGYIDNDYYAVKNEENPSIRLSEDQSVMGVIQFIAIRLFYSALVAYFMFRIDSEMALLLCVCSIVNLAIYLVHNRLKRRYRLPTYTVLKASHVLIPLIPVVSNNEIFLSIVIFYLPAQLFAYAVKINLIKTDLDSILRRVYLIQFVLLFFILMHFKSAALILCLYFMIGEVARMLKKHYHIKLI
jgi:phosphoserine phosphatase